MLHGKLHVRFSEFIIEYSAYGPAGSTQEAGLCMARPEHWKTEVYNNMLEMWGITGQKYSVSQAIIYVFPSICDMIICIIDLPLL